VAVGARFDDRVTGKVDAFAPTAEIIHVDIDPSSISKNIKVDIPIVGDCKRVLAALLEAVKEEMKTYPAGAVREARRQWASRSGSGSVRSPFATNGPTTSSSRST
jgi:acetolactate synthase-1/2/3 large subunit